jgi:Gti1/Pac2 family
LSNSSHSLRPTSSRYARLLITNQTGASSYRHLIFKGVRYNILSSQVLLRYAPCLPPPLLLVRISVSSPPCHLVLSISANRASGIRGSADAFILFEAVRTGLLPLRRSRLSQREREGLAAGQVFVWVESTEADGLERWTDGRKWCARRTMFIPVVPSHSAYLGLHPERGMCFLFTRSAMSHRWTKVSRKLAASQLFPSLFASVLSFTPRYHCRIKSYRTQTNSTGELFGIFAFPCDRQPKPGGLIKQTFSAWVEDSTRTRTKWHLSVSQSLPTYLVAVA